jgi:post-segregation antitoxin (ccd killing protein)
MPRRRIGAARAANAGERRAKEANLCAAGDEAVAELMRGRRAEVWLRRNRAAIGAYNAHVEGGGAYGDGVRTF